MPATFANHELSVVATKQRSTITYRNRFAGVCVGSPKTFGSGISQCGDHAKLNLAVWSSMEGQLLSWRLLICVG